MNKVKITQDNVHLLLPNKVAQIADRLMSNGVAADITTALNIIYSSPVYRQLERENTKYWCLGVNTLLYDIVKNLPANS